MERTQPTTDYKLIFERLPLVAQAVVVLETSPHPYAREATKSLLVDRTEKEARLILGLLQATEEQKVSATRSILTNRVGPLRADQDVVSSAAKAIEEWIDRRDKTDAENKSSDGERPTAPSKSSYETLNDLFQREQWDEAFRIAQGDTKSDQPALRGIGHFFMGLLVEKKESIERSYSILDSPLELAKKHYLEATETGDPEIKAKAHLRLGLLSMKIDSSSYSSYPLAKSHFEKAVETGDPMTQAKAHLKLGSLYRKHAWDTAGDLLKEEQHNKVKEHYKAAIEVGDPRTQARAHFKLGNFFTLIGEPIFPLPSIEANVKRGFEHYEAALLLGDPGTSAKVHLKLGQLYENPTEGMMPGLSQSEGLKKAREHFEAAARCGDKKIRFQAESTLARLFEDHGNAIAPELSQQETLKKAREYYEALAQVADKGQVDWIQLRLGDLFLKHGDTIAPELSSQARFKRAQAHYEAVIYSDEDEYQQEANLCLGVLFRDHGEEIAPELSPYTRFKKAERFFDRASGCESISMFFPETKVQAYIELSLLFSGHGEKVKRDLSEDKILAESKRYCHLAREYCEKKRQNFPFWKPTASYWLGNLFSRFGALIEPNLTEEERLRRAVEYYKSALTDSNSKIQKKAEEEIRACEEKLSSLQG